MTLPEVVPWQHLRRRPDELKFRRQHPAGPYVLDFYCEEARLCIEVDGAAHGFGNAGTRDEHRDRWLREAGYSNAPDCGAGRAEQSGWRAAADHARM
jgi:very-short-patch-repair endonuclease